MSLHAPLVFRPWLRPMPWGGDALKKHYPGLNFNQHIGEVWLLSKHSLHDSVVEQGPFYGLSLGQLLQQFPDDIYGDHPHATFPLLIKILDAREHLSVQVHPSDVQAQVWCPSERGKSEAWTVLESESEGSMFIGLCHGITIDDWRTKYSQLDIPSTLSQIRPSVGETYAIPPGTIHALGSGVIVLEVQQSSDATFRLYDWGRVGTDGTPRQLHIAEGLACLTDDAHAGLQTPVFQQNGSELLVQSQYFTLYRWKQARVVITTPSIIIPWNGSAQCQTTTIPHGTACLVPASLNNAEIHTAPGTMLFEIQWH